MEGIVRTRKNSGSFDWAAAATMHAYAARHGQGNVDDYRRICNAMIERFVEPNVRTTHHILKCCLILPDSKVNLDRLAIDKLSEAGFRDATAELRSWYALTLAMAAYRDQRSEDALDFTRQIAGGDGALESASNAIKSLAFSSQGKTAEARAAIDAAIASLTGHIEYLPDESLVGESVVTNGVIVHDLLIADLLIREATEALRKAL